MAGCNIPPALIVNHALAPTRGNLNRMTVPQTCHFLQAQELVVHHT